ncbi:MAG: DUF4469 domain-containing protein [Tannerellaceae bacterium]|jgi:hypothetical protein|nr:DUF4469 domain-containing protein [Tannerellaceae bacterium]
MSNIFHKIRANLYKNYLTEDPDDYSIRVIADRSLNISEVCEIAVSRGGADVTAAAMEHAVELWLKEMGYQLCDGYSINTGWFTASVNVKGVVNNPLGQYDPDKHTIIFEFHQGALMRKEIPSITVEIQGAPNTDGYIAQVLDVKTGSINNLLTVDRNLRISGSRLKIAGDGKYDSIGVYFHGDSGATVKVDPTDIVINNPSELMVVIPSVPMSSTCTLEIITQYTVGYILKEPRSITFDQVLTFA